MRTKRQKQNGAMFYLSRRSILASSQLGSKTYEIIWFFSSNAKYGSIDKMDGFLSQTNRLSNWGGAKHSHAFWESSRAWEWLRFQSELCRIVRNTRTHERFFDQMSGIARLTKSNCPRQTDACMKGPRARNKSFEKCTRVLRTPFSLALRKWETQVQTPWVQGFTRCARWRDVQVLEPSRCKLEE